MTLLFAYDDHSNFMYNNYMSLKGAGVECECMKIKKHPFGYIYEAPVVSHEVAIEKVRQADMIHFFHSNKEWFKRISPMLKGKKIVIYHTGTAYRNNPAGMNELFNPYAAMTITDQCEFMLLGAKNIHYMATAIDHTEVYSVQRPLFLPYIVAHYPSNPETKGTEKISEMINRIQHNNRMRVLISGKKVSYKEQLVRMGECDIYIELFAPSQNENPYGCYGVSAFEAAAQGKVVITQNINNHVYKEAYGWDHPFIICNTEGEFVYKLHELICKPKEEIQLLQDLTRQWIVEKHSYSATGNYLKKILSGI